MRIFAALLLLPALAAVPAAAEDAGERLFAPCRACHSLDPAERGLPGPNLGNLIGRRIAGDPAFDYSPVLRKARDHRVAQPVIHHRPHHWLSTSGRQQGILVAVHLVLRGTLKLRNLSFLGSDQMDNLLRDHS